MNLKTLLLILVTLGLTILAIATWGSVGSAVCIYCLIVMAAALLFKRFLVNRDGSDYQMED
jgi:hypothetical protein